MITMRNYPYLLITLFASLLLAVFLQAQTVLAQHSLTQQSSTIHLPVIANGQSLDSLESYRVTHTSIFIHPNSSSPEHIAQTYEWQQAANQYGFNASAKVRVGEAPMLEAYLIGEDAYDGIGVVNSIARSEIDLDASPTPSIVMPPLTLNGENGEFAFLGPDGGLPVAISEIISQSQKISTEIVSGVLASRYQSNDATLLARQVFFGPETEVEINSARGDFWLADDGEHIVKFVVYIEADNGATHYLEYALDNINSLPDLEPPV